MKNNWADTTKGIGILLVIIGHTYGGFSSKIIFLFHMPLFFFLSGMLLSEKPPIPYFIKKSKRLIGSYLLYIIVLVLIDFTSKYIKHELTLPYISSMLKNCIVGGRALTGWFGVFWFLSVLFISQQITNLIILKSNKAIAALLFTGMLSLAYLNNYTFKEGLPLSLDAVLYAAPIMYIGNLFKNCNPPIAIFILSFASLISFSVVPFHKFLNFDMKQGEYGVIACSLIISITISYIIIFFSKNIEINFLTFLGKGSMAIMFSHQIIHLAIAEHISNNRLVVTLITISLSIFYYFFIIKISDKYMLKLMKYAY
ncbi:acyltransferase family protein [Klebsiella oxytoca]|uniref:acyltransferase family protein n=1 Tax=Klebsiella oxytoca TaxID=571 RepID=UPI00157A599F|nr:acyltransferase family protein [Klebsiella oxytoca]